MDHWIRIVVKTQIPIIINHCFNPWFVGSLDKNHFRLTRSDILKPGFNPWFVGSLDKNYIKTVFFSFDLLVSILGLLDYWIRIIAVKTLIDITERFNPWFVGLLDKNKHKPN